MKIYVCDIARCQNGDFYEKAKSLIQDNGINAQITNDGCLRACSLLKRVDVYLENQVKRYAQRGYNRDPHVFYEVGDDPLKTIILNNLPKQAKKRKK